MVWSEFSRRIPQNDNGTDHGSQGPMFVIGGAVTGGVYGNHPNIDPGALDDDGNTIYSQAAATRSARPTSATSTAPSSKHWLNMTAADDPVERPDARRRQSGDYWTVPNFDMGFLP